MIRYCFKHLAGLGTALLLILSPPVSWSHPQTQALAPKSIADRPESRLSITHQLLTKHIIVARSEGQRKILDDNASQLVLLPNGKYLVGEEMAADSLWLVRGIIHQDVHVAMEIMQRKEPARYRQIREYFFRNTGATEAYEKQRPDKELPGFLSNMILNDAIATAIELDCLINQKLALPDDVTAEEKAYLRAVIPLLRGHATDLFFGETYDIFGNRAIIHQTARDGFAFSNIRSKPPSRPADNAQQHPLVRLYGMKIMSTIVRALADTDPSVRLAALNALGNYFKASVDQGSIPNTKVMEDIAEERPQAFDIFVQQIRLLNSPQVREFSILAGDEMWPERQEANEILISIYKHMLHKGLQVDAKKITQLMDRALRDPQWRVRMDALRKLEPLYVSMIRAKKPIRCMNVEETLLEDPHHWPREVAAWFLGAICIENILAGYPVDLLPLRASLDKPLSFEGLEASATAWGRSLAVMEKMRRQSAPIRDVHELLGNPLPHLRIAGTIALASYLVERIEEGGPEDTKALEALLEDPDVGVRRNAGEFLTKIYSARAARGQEVKLEIILPWLKNEELAKNAEGLLAKIIAFKILQNIGHPFQEIEKMEQPYRPIFLKMLQEKRNDISRELVNIHLAWVQEKRNFDLEKLEAFVGDAGEMGKVYVALIRQGKKLDLNPLKKQANINGYWGDEARFALLDIYAEIAAQGGDIDLNEFDAVCNQIHRCGHLHLAQAKVYSALIRRGMRVDLTDLGLCEESWPLFAGAYAEMIRSGRNVARAHRQRFEKLSHSNESSERRSAAKILESICAEEIRRGDNVDMDAFLNNASDPDPEVRQKSITILGMIFADLQGMPEVKQSADTFFADMQAFMETAQRLLQINFVQYAENNAGAEQLKDILIRRMDEIIKLLNHPAGRKKKENLQAIFLEELGKKKAAAIKIDLLMQRMMRVFSDRLRRAEDIQPANDEVTRSL